MIKNIGGFLTTSYLKKKFFLEKCKSEYIKK